MTGSRLDHDAVDTADTISTIDEGHHEVGEPGNQMHDKVLDLCSSRVSSLWWSVIALVWGQDSVMVETCHRGGLFVRSILALLGILELSVAELICMSVLYSSTDLRDLIDGLPQFYVENNSWCHIHVTKIAGEVKPNASSAQQCQVSSSFPSFSRSHSFRKRMIPFVYS